MRYTCPQLLRVLTITAGVCASASVAIAADPPNARAGEPPTGERQKNTKPTPQTQPRLTQPGTQPEAQAGPQGETGKKPGSSNGNTGSGNKAGAATKDEPAPKVVAPKGIAVQSPRTPIERDKALANLYALLATAADEAQAKTVADQIERLWAQGSDTTAVLMDRAHAALVAKNTDLALRFLNAVVDLDPAHSEGWNRRAHLYMGKSDVERALGDLRRVLALDPHHFRALDDLVQILRTIGQKKAALQAARQLLEVHPFWDGAKKTVEELAREVEGQSL
jgi:tetratricopeptide (TPR) repeat protein